jgi:hypothetical protein
MSTTYRPPNGERVRLDHATNILGIYPDHGKALIRRYKLRTIRSGSVIFVKVSDLKSAIEREQAEERA